MARLRPLWLVAPFLLGACSVINAPAEISLGGGGAGGSTGGTGGDTGGTGGVTTTSAPMTTTTEESICGDGKLTGAEGCDDDNTQPGDGCSGTCTIEMGWDCTTDPQETSICEQICGNGTIDAADGEECDDSGATDDAMIPGNQDACSATCKSQEFDIESGPTNDMSIVFELPVAAYRNDGDVSTFFAVWRAAAQNKLFGRGFFFDGKYAKSPPTQEDMAPTPSPEPSGQVFCTTGSNRSIYAWRDADEGKVYWRKIEQNGSFGVPTEIAIPSGQNRLACAANPSNKSIVAVIGKPAAGPLFDIWIQPFNIQALPGVPVDIGDTLSPNQQIASWPLANSFMVAWIADPAAGGAIGAQQLNGDGQLMPGFFNILTDAQDVIPRDPTGARVGSGDQFALVYTRDSVPDANNVVHREIALRVFQSPGSGGAPKIVSTTNVTDQKTPLIVSNPSNGKFVVVWAFDATGGENIAYRVFSPQGMPVGDEQIANEGLLGAQTHPAAVVDPKTGDVVILWDNFLPNSDKPHRISAKIFARLLAD